MFEDSPGQDGGVGRYALLPRRTKRRKQQIKKKKKKPDCQKIELCGSPTTKDLKKKHSFRW